MTSKLTDQEEDKSPQVFGQLDSNPIVAEQRKKKNSVIERVVSNRIKNQMTHLRLKDQLKSDCQSSDKPIIQEQESQRRYKTASQSIQTSPTSKQSLLYPQQRQHMNISCVFKGNRQHSQPTIPSPKEECLLMVPRQFKVSKQLENMESLKNQLRKNYFFHSDFNPSLGNQESNAFYSALYQPGKDHLSDNYNNIYDYFCKNKVKILQQLKKSQKLKLVETRKVFEFKKQGISEQDLKKRQHEPFYDKQSQVYKNPQHLFEHFQDKLEIPNEQVLGLPKNEEERQQQRRILKSIQLMKDKYESKQKIDPLRSLDKLGIDLIIQNQDLLERFQSKINQSIAIGQQAKNGQFMTEVKFLRKSQSRLSQSVDPQNSKIDKSKAKNRDLFYKFLSDNSNKNKKKVEEQLLEDNSDYSRVQSQLSNRKLRKASQVTFQNRYFENDINNQEINSPNNKNLHNKQNHTQNNFFRQRFNNSTTQHHHRSESTDSNSQARQSRVKFIPSQQKHHRFNSLLKFFRQTTDKFDKNQSYDNNQQINNLDQLLDRCEQYRQENPSLKKSVDLSIKKEGEVNQHLKDALTEYLLISEDEEAKEHKNIEKIQKKHAEARQEMLDNYMTPEQLEVFKEKSKQTTLYLATVGRKKIWKPEKFSLARKLQVAESLTDLLEKRLY